MLQAVEVGGRGAEAEEEGDHVGPFDEDGAVGDVFRAELHDLGDGLVVRRFEDLLSDVQLWADGGGCR